ncbi:hypothetical protein ACFQUU_15205 [Herbaspirillum sp. GCM10030257]|uniref:hypothetical protein n=1 Tax=Herbaspirillum sp. GCM10030257 TaxID=3273393 RepID=UPI0036176075
MPLKLTGLKQALVYEVKTVNDLILMQLCDWLDAEHGVRVGVSTLSKTLVRLGISLKKRRSMRASKPVRT